MTDAPVAATDPHPVPPFDPGPAFLESSPAPPSDAELDAEIRADVEALAGAMRTAVERAWNLGRRLTERKRRLQHGEWLPYLDRIGLPVRTAQDCMAIAAKYAQCAHLPATLEAARQHLRLPAPERRLAETLRLWPGLASRMGDPSTRTVVERYAAVTAAVFAGAKDWPSDADLAWAAGVEGLFDREAS